jgi:hypothetical protein
MMDEGQAPVLRILRLRAGRRDEARLLVHGGHERSRQECKSPRHRTYTPRTTEAGAWRHRVRVPTDSNLWGT